VSQFSFLESEFDFVFEAAEKAERYALSDPGTAAIHARRALESGVKWAFKNDRALPQPYEDQLNTYLNEPAFKALADGRLFPVAKRIQRAGNRAVHESKPLEKLEAVDVVSALFQFCLWLAHAYGRTVKPDPAAKFDPHKLMDAGKAEKASLKERQELEERLDREAEEAELARQRLAEAHLTIEELEAERAALMAEVAAAKKAAELVPVGVHDWSEAETRAYKIDALLAEAGWPLADERDREFPVKGMPSDSGEGFVDYVLWGDDGLPLAVIEAKRSTVSATTGQQQAKLYADCLEEMTGQRPVIFYSNGFEHWLWDDTQYPPRGVQGFLTKDELALLIQRRATKQSLTTVDIDAEIVERDYQHRAIRAIGEHFENDKQRKSLLVMATGAGKTRTVIALSDLLMRANWAKRILFLCDRTALVNQAVGAFKAHLPGSAPINLVTEGDQGGRVYVSTYQTMIGKIDEYRPDGTRRFGVGHFDLVVIDEAHRSVYRKYRGIFEYFDSLLVGLTATPKDEVDKNTYDLFDLETGVPTDAYSLDEAIADGYLVPPKGVSVPLKFVREGIKYEALSEDEKTEWDELDWGEDEDGNPIEPPEQVEAAKLNKWLFNIDTVDKALEHLMTNGIKVAGGDRLGKTIVFAKNQAHADFIYERFIANYPNLDKGNFARIITYNTKYAQSLIDDFSNKDKSPHIAISVDMLDTGIDVPECVNLVFFKLVRSKTKFWQMIGRGTRLCPDLFGPGDDKRAFNVFDFCQNLEYFSQTLVPADKTGAAPLSEQLFKARLDLVEQLDAVKAHGEERSEIADVLREALASMNEHNFLVRPHLQLVEKFREPDAWEMVTTTDLAGLREQVASLPDQLDPEHEDAKRFDMIVLNAQLRLLRGEPYEAQRTRMMKIAGLLEDQHTIPVIAAQLELIQDIGSDEWWVDATYPMLEDVRKRLRLLVPLIEKAKKGQVFTDIEDDIGTATTVVLPGTIGDGDTAELAQFRKKARHFLKEHLAEEAVAKVRSGEPLAPDDIAELQRILVAAGIGNDETFAAASEQAGSFGLFIRSLVGLDRAAAKAAFNDFLDEQRYSKNQLAFIGLVIDYLTEHGTIEPARIYESPFTGVAPQGPDELFAQADVERLFEVINDLLGAAG
jgi:type I restriction enzyme R subunit